MHGVPYLKCLASAFAVQVVLGDTQPTVQIANGTLNGLSLPQFGQEQFLGIPYAQQPVGQLRLRAPRSINASFGNFQATEYSPHCWSAYTTGFDDNSGFPNSEACLTLNIVRPIGTTEKDSLPVNVWIHGGGFTTGGSADYRYNGTALVQASVDNGHPILFVSLNYRLASLGFLGGKALQDEGSLNLGIRDQRLALHWVQENIVAFGGDSSKVTIQGESAGGFSVNCHVTAYGGRNDSLFHQAIVESGQDYQPYGKATASVYQATYNALIINTSCSSTANQPEESQLECIRTLPIDEFRKASIGTTGLIEDDDILQGVGFVDSFTKGKWVKVPFLLGTNTDEGRSFSPQGYNTTEEVQNALVESGYVPAAAVNKTLELYPDDPAQGCPFNTGDFQLSPIQNGAFATPGSQNKRIAAIVGDAFIPGAGRYVAQTISNEVPFYKYRFNHRPWSISYGTADYIEHFMEVSYVFNLQNNDTDFWVANHFTASYLGPGAPIEDRALGVYMSRSWAAFVATGDPNNANYSTKVNWPTYSSDAEQIVFQTQGSTIEKDDYRASGISYLAQAWLATY